MNPFDGLADIFLDATAKVWIRLMLLIWGAGLWVLRLELTLMDKFLTPDVSAGGPLAGIARIGVVHGDGEGGRVDVLAVGLGPEVEVVARDEEFAFSVDVGTGAQAGGWPVVQTHSE